MSGLVMVMDIIGQLPRVTAAPGDASTVVNPLNKSCCGGSSFHQMSVGSEKRFFGESGTKSSCCDCSNQVRSSDDCDGKGAEGRSGSNAHTAEHAEEEHKISSHEIAAIW